MENSTSPTARYLQTYFLGKTVAADSPVEEPKNEIRKTAYNLPPNFEWTEVDINIEEELNELYVLLSENYVEDTESLFRFDYPDKFLDWALKSPGWRKEWHIGIRKSDCKELVAFVSAIPISLTINDR